MAKKRTSLDAILPTQGRHVELATEAAPTMTAPSKDNPRIGRRPHVKQQALYLKHPVHRQLRALAFEEEKKMHDLCLEALDLLFADRGLPCIASLETE